MRITNFLSSSLSKFSLSTQFSTTWRGRQIIVGILGLLTIGFIIRKMCFSQQTQTSSKPEGKPPENGNTTPNSAQTYYKLAPKDQIIEFRTLAEPKKNQVYDKNDITIKIGTTSTKMGQLESVLGTQGWENAAIEQTFQLIKQIPCRLLPSLAIYNHDLLLTDAHCIISKNDQGKPQVVFNNFRYKDNAKKIYYEFDVLTASYKESHLWNLEIKTTIRIAREIHPAHLLGISSTMQSFIENLTSEATASPIKAGLISSLPVKIERTSNATQATDVDPFLTSLKNADQIHGWEKLGTAFQNFVLKAIADEDFSHEENLSPSFELKSAQTNQLYFMLIKFMVKEKSFQIGLQIDLKTYQPTFGGRSEIDLMTINSGFYVEWQTIKEGQDLPELTICK